MNNIYVVNVNNVNVDEEKIPIFCQKQVNKYSLKSDKKRSLIGWFFLNKILKEKYDLNLEKEKIITNKYGKPYIEKKVYFNITHSDNFIGIIVSNKECGIDIEKIDKSKSNNKLAQKTLTKKEYLEYLKSNDKCKYFFEKWVIKEAYYKQKGTGITLQNIRKRIRRKPHLENFIDKEDSYVLAVFPKSSKSNIVFI